MIIPTTSEGPMKKKRDSAVAESVFDDFPLEKAHMNYWDTLMHLLKGCVGASIFMMGDAFRNGGLFFGPVCIIIIGTMTVHCQHMLLSCAKKIFKNEQITDPKPSSYGETAMHTFVAGPQSLQKYARRMKHSINVILYLTELAFCCICFVFVAEHFQQIAGYYGWEYNVHQTLTFVLIPMWLLTFLGNSRMLMPVAFIEKVLIWMAIFIILYFTVQNLGLISERNYIVDDFKRLPLCFGTILYAFEGITFVIPLANQMENPDNFVAWYGVLNLGSFLVSAIYCTIGFLSYYKYGDDMRASVFLNFESKHILAHCIKVLIIVGVMLTFALHMYIPFEMTYPIIRTRFGPFKYPKVFVVLFKTVLVLLTFFVASGVPFLGLFISLIGSSSVAILTLILPPLLHMVAFKGEQHVICFIKDIAIMIVGIIIFITGTSLGLYAIVLAFGGEHISN